MIVIIDFGSQYNQLIARRVRENHVFCQIEPPGIPLATLKALQPEGIILSGGPSSIYEAGSPRSIPDFHPRFRRWDLLGMQFMTAARRQRRARKARVAASLSCITARRGCSKGSAGTPRAG
jgi:hypothetical protein